MGDWTDEFFDEAYFKIWGALTGPEASDEHAQALWVVCDIAPGARVLDAPCGYGRVSQRLAARGARVMGLDLSPALLAEAERTRGRASAEQLVYRQQDLRQPFPEQGFEVVLNLFSSLGYGSDEEDAALLVHFFGALVPGGRLFIDTMHRDTLVAAIAGGRKLAFRTPDGTLVQEDRVFDAVRGRAEATWYWSGPSGTGQRTFDLRVYSVTELITLVEGAGFEIEGLYAGCSTERWEAEGPEMGGRVGLLARKPT